MALCAGTSPRLQRFIAESRNSDLNATQSQPPNPATNNLLSQARGGLQTTARQLEAASFTGRCVHLQIHSLSQFQTCATGRSGTGRVSARRHADGVARCADELDVHVKEEFDRCDADHVPVRTVLEGTDLNFVNATAEVYCEILLILGECLPK